MTDYTPSPEFKNYISTLFERLWPGNTATPTPEDIREAFLLYPAEVVAYALHGVTAVSSMSDNLGLRSILGEIAEEAVRSAGLLETD